ncbi:MAG: lipoate--protein ligase family protein [Deltaproteobacteria bacterium]|nr:lipoate--protein ligase family protein [Deltaproteobacteria bacterium]
MGRLRLLKTHYTYAELSTTLSPALEKSLEERQAPGTLVVNFFSADSITIGVLEDPEKSLDLDSCREQGIVVRRRQNPGGAVFANQGSVMTCVYLNMDQPWIPFKGIREAFPYYLERMARVVSERFGLHARYRPVNDIEVDGRKLVATSARLENRVLTLRSVINVRPVDRGVMSRAIIARPEKFQDKQQKDGGSRFTCLQEEAGRPIQPKEMVELAIKTMNKVFGPELEITEGTLSPLEDQYFHEYQEQFSADEWFYANSERTRFAHADPAARKVEAYHKAPAGLMGLALLALEGRIHDLILLADFHPSPYSVIGQLEDALRGQPLELDAIMARVDRAYHAPGVEIPGTGLSDFAALFDKALKHL